MKHKWPARLLALQEGIGAARWPAKVDSEQVVPVDTVDDRGVVARGPGDGPDIDGAGCISDGRDLRPGAFARVISAQPAPTTWKHNGWIEICSDTGSASTGGCWFRATRLTQPTVRADVGRMLP